MKLRKVWIVGERKPIVQSTDKHGVETYRLGKNGGPVIQQKVELHYKYVAAR
jgi:hypothetical protein